MLTAGLTRRRITSALLGFTLLTGFVGTPAAHAQPGTDQTNLALGRTASQSSEYETAAPAARAVDGNRDGGFWNGSLSHTAEQDEAWWQVDLESRRPIGGVTIFNRTDCCIARLADFYVLVSNTPFTSNSLEATRKQSGVTAIHVDRVATKVEVPVGRDGRYVRIQLAGHNPLALAEVEVRSAMPAKPSPYRNLALAAKTSQSSVADGGASTRAQDGNTNGAWSGSSLSNTTSEANPWWQADLGTSKPLTSVRVFNRTDCCTDRLRDFYVLTSDRPFASTDLQQTLRQPGVTAIRVRNIGADKSLDLRGTARYVRIQSTLTGYLTLAEVQIFGTEPLTQPNVAEHIRTNQFGMFIHYGPGTYTNEQWATPGTSPSVFNPTALDTDQWAAAAKSAGMSYGVLTTKHHDGFALWDTASNTYDVASSPYQGDVVQRYADSFRKAGLGVGLYYSIWDRTNGETTELVINQLRELLTRYGFVNQLWFDAWTFAPGYAKIPYEQVRDFVRNVSPGTVIANNDKNDTIATSDVLEYEDGRPPAGITEPVQMSDMISTSNWDWFNTDQSLPPRTTEDIVAEETYQRDHGYQYLLNVGPGKDGRMAEVYTNRLAEVGAALR
ncbi:alpha-L-fucosidase [Kribbella lupini]|uniref:alpha-L-fucosidase n=1 Tax=Kribbella lupini TaxID=291602 RepID=A0ABP4LP58_9ACTN